MQVNWKGMFIKITLFMAAGFVLAKGSGSISGFIHDEENGEGLIGVNVYLEGTTVGASTNLSGYYVIPKVDAGDYTMIVRYIGYTTLKERVRLQADHDMKMNLNMKEDVIQMQAIAVSADSERVIEKLYYKPISEIALTPREIQRVPQFAEADLLRTLQTLPGIKPISDFSSDLYVRGGTPDQNLYLLDGTDVYNAEHAFGLFSTFNTESIKQVEISKGGFGAEYGGRLSSVLNVTNLDGNREYFEGSASISLLSAKTTIQMPLSDKGAISGSIRRTYFDKTIGPSMSDVPDYYFWDGNVKAYYDINKNNKLTFSMYGGQDVLDLKFNTKATNQEGFLYKWGNHTGSLRWTHVFSPRMFSNFWITASKFKSDLNMVAYYFDELNQITDVTLKGNLEYHPINQISTKFGFEAKKLDGKFLQEAVDDGRIDIQYHPKQITGYVQTNWKPTPLWDVQLGCRFNRFESDTAFHDFAPRLAVKRRLSDTQILRAAAGTYYQYLQRVPRFIASDIWSASNTYQARAKSNHFILGYQQEISQDYSLEIEGFYKTYENIYDFNDNVGVDIETSDVDQDGQPIYRSTKGVFNRGDGDSKGFELLLRKDIGRCTGWVGYALMRTEYKMDGLNSDRYFRPRHDRTSSLNVVMNLSLDKRGKWKLGSNIIYASGQPITEPGSGYFISGFQHEPLDLVYAPTRINNIRLPYYARLDLSLTYTKKYSGWTMQPYVQVYNVGNRKNVWFVNYEYNNGQPKPEEQYMLPILPTFGVNITF